MHSIGIIFAAFMLATTTASWLPFADDSCVGRCNAALDPSKPCQCNTACKNYNDCCVDYDETCLASCAGRCGNAYDPNDVCHCNSQCKDYNNCCGDYDTHCVVQTTKAPVPVDSCAGRCGNAYDPNDACHCNSLCKDYNNCCTDYDAYCQIPGGTCLNRCDNPLDPNEPCQCNSACLTNGDCCPDYGDLCEGSGPITPGDLSALADDLWASDTSRAGPSEYTLNKQTQVPDGNTEDQAPQKLFTSVNEAAVFSRPTFAAFISLLDNYNPNYGQNEQVTPDEEAELQNFLDVVMATKVMTKTANFLISKGQVVDAADFRAQVERVWFTLYDRSSPTDSSGFEHVFMGEYKSGSKINGFHNWVQFYFLEKAGELNYLGYVRDDVTTDMIGANFDWNGYKKAMGSFMYGASPEFELAMMSTCFIAFPGKYCGFFLHGNSLGIQTYTIHDNLVGSSYFSL